MKYKSQIIKDNNDHIFFPPKCNSDEDLNECSGLNDAIDPSILANLFQSIGDACKRSDVFYLIDLFYHLGQVYSSGPIDSLEIATEYNFPEICSDLLTMCGSDKVIVSLLSCINLAIQSDPNILIMLSNPTFAEQLAYCIDEKGSCTFSDGFNILSQVIQGYSQPLFAKICYIFRTTSFQSDDLTDIDIKNLNSFGKVFLQLAKFVDNKSYLVMLMIGKIFLFYGLFNYGVGILTNVIEAHEDAKNQIFVLNKLSKNQISEIGDDGMSFYSDFTTNNEIGNSFENIEPSIFSVLYKTIPYHKEQSEFFNFDYDTALTNTLTLVNDLLDEWGNFYIYSMNNIDIECLYELMNYDENPTIQSLSLSIFAEIYGKDKKMNELIEESDCIVKAIDTFLTNMDDMPMHIRRNALKGIYKLTKAIYDDSQLDMETKAEFFNICCERGIFEKLLDFFISDSNIQVDSAFVLWLWIDICEEARKKSLAYLEDLESMEFEEQDSRMRTQLHLINLKLRKETDEDFYN